MSEGPRTVRVRIAGRVQGVSYRAWTCQAAGRLGLAGWVRNRMDGSVEALFAGRPENVAVMLEACRRGPRLARVDTVSVEEAPGHDPAPGFLQRETV